MNIEEHIKETIEYCNKKNFFNMFIDTNIGSVGIFLPFKYLNDYINAIRNGKAINVIKFFVSAITKEEKFFSFVVSQRGYNKTYIEDIVNGEIFINQHLRLLYSTNLLNFSDFSQEIDRIEDFLFYKLRAMNLDLDKEYISSKELLKKLFDGYVIPISNDKKVIVRIKNNELSEDFSVEYEGEGIHIIGVRFKTQSYGCYYYLGDNACYQVGDDVEVYTRNNGWNKAEVVYKKIYYDQKELPYRLDQLSNKIRKINY